MQKRMKDRTSKKKKAKKQKGKVQLRTLEDAKRLLRQARENTRELAERELAGEPPSGTLNQIRFF